MAIVEQFWITINVPLLERGQDGKRPLIPNKGENGPIIIELHKMPGQYRVNRVPDSGRFSKEGGVALLRRPT